MTNPIEPDRPCNRGYEWFLRSTKLKEEYDYTCQVCGVEYGKLGNRFINIETHHIVKGRHLPIDDARCELNLIPVCDRRCHGRMEAANVEEQYRLIGWHDVADTVALLKGGRVTPEYVSLQTEMPVLRAYGVLQQLARIRVARQVSGRLYELRDDPRERTGGEE